LKSKPVSVGAQEDGLQAEFYIRALDQAQKLFEGGNPHPAAVLAGTVLENYLRWLWRRRNIKVEEKGFSMAEINDFLYKFWAYYHATYIRVQGLIPIAEACLDPRKKTPSKREIGSFITAVKKVVGSAL
jgi:hypothetical protein